MKNKKGIVLLIAALIVLIIIIIAIIMLNTNSKKNDNNDAETNEETEIIESFPEEDEVIEKTEANYKLLDLLNANSYKVEIKMTEIAHDMKENFIWIEKNKNEQFEYVKTSWSKDQFYKYNGKNIFQNSDKDVWFYESEILVSSNQGYVSSLLKLLEILTNRIYNLNEDGKYVYNVKNPLSLDKIADKYYDVEHEQTIINTNNGKVKKLRYHVSKVEVSIENNNVNNIKMIVKADCTEEYEYFCRTYTYDFTFDKINSINASLPKEVLDSLDKTTAKDWVGEYTNTITCPNEKTMTNRISLKENFQWLNGEGWEATLKIKHNCEDGSYYFTNKNYIVENGKIYIYDDIRDKTLLYQLNYLKDKLELLDENGNILETFYKEVNSN